MALSADLTAASWKVFSDLLDRGLELPVEQRAAWVDTLDAEHDSLKPALRAVLERSGGAEIGQWLDTLPHTAGAASTDDSELHADALVGPYRLLREIGVGGMGAVWLAERADGSLKRRVALKLPRASWSRGLAERMARERDILASLEHPNIARLYDAGTDTQGRPFLALEYVEGEPIDVYCRQRALGIKARLQLLLQVAQAVAFAHSRLVVHRDLKPSNILVTAEGQVRLLDFGIAKLVEGDRAEETQLTQLAGRALTLDYASPEQIRGEPLGTASDVYSLGVVAYELLAGAKPYKLKRRTAAQLEEAIAAIDAPLASAVATDPAGRRELKGDLDAILNKALKKNPSERYATIDALAQDLRRYLDGARVLARPDTISYRLYRMLRRHRTAVAAGTIVVVSFGVAIGFGATALVVGALLAGIGAAAWQAKKARDEAQRSRVEAHKAEAVKKFLLDIFLANTHMQGDPLKAQQTTARELLDIGVGKVDESLRDQPEPRIEILATLGDLYWEVGLRQECARLYERATALARSVFGPRDLKFARVALGYARALSATPQRAQVPAVLQDADAALRAAGDASAPDRGLLLHELAAYYRHQALDKFLQTAEEAADLMRSQPAGVEAINVFRLAGRARMSSGHYDLAEAHYRRALTAVAALEKGLGEALSVNADAELAEALFAQGKISEAIGRLRQARATAERIHGPQHRWTLVIQVRLANALVAGASGAEGLALRTQVESTLAQPRPEYDASFRAEMAAYLAICPTMQGRPDLALPFHEQDVEDLRQSFPGSPALAMTLSDLADALIAYGRYDEAEPMVDEALATWRSYTGDKEVPARRAHVAAVRVHLARARGRAAQAIVEAESVELPGTRELGRFHPATLRLVAERALAETMAGRSEVAQARLTRELHELEQLARDGRQPLAEARLLSARAKARERLGEAAGAAADYQQGIALRERHDDPNSLWLAADLAHFAACLARLNRLQEAAAAEQRAAAILMVHPAPGLHLFPVGLSVLQGPSSPTPFPPAPH